MLMAKPPYTGMELTELLPNFRDCKGVLEELEAGTDYPPYLSSDHLPVSVEDLARPGGRSGLDGLTPREIEVLCRIAEGHSTKQLADMLGMSFKTAACHRYRIMDKLGIHDAVTLTRYAVRNGLVRL
jgi:DNA-binding NarL/FixJ family response regulator